MSNAGLAWDHGKRRVIAALLAGIVALAIAISSIGGSATSVEASRKAYGWGSFEAPAASFMGSSWG